MVLCSTKGYCYTLLLAAWLPCIVESVFGRKTLINTVDPLRILGFKIPK